MHPNNYPGKEAIFEPRLVQTLLAGWLCPCGTLDISPVAEHVRDKMAQSSACGEDARCCWMDERE